MNAATCPSQWYENLLRGRRAGMDPVFVARALRWARLNPEGAKRLRKKLRDELLRFRRGGM